MSTHEWIVQECVPHDLRSRQLRKGDVVCIGSRVYPPHVVLRNERKGGDVWVLFVEQMSSGRRFTIQHNGGLDMVKVGETQSEADKVFEATVARLLSERGEGDG